MCCSRLSIPLPIDAVERGNRTQTHTRKQFVTVSNVSSVARLSRDLTAGMVVFLVAIPLCLGIALASNAPLLSGIISGVVGGIVVGMLSRSPTSVSGPAAALAAIVATEISRLGSFETFQLAVIVGGVLQLIFGVARAGAIAAFIPSSVVKGLMAAIGVLLILKQIPHLLGHDADPEGEMSFHQPDGVNTFAELGHMFGHIHPGAVTIGVGALLLLIAWNWFKPLRTSFIPAPLAVVVFGITAGLIFQELGGMWGVEPSNFVQVPVFDSLREPTLFFSSPNFEQLTNPQVYTAGLTIALAASLGTLLNLESVDKLDPQQRTSPPSRELVAQGVGNVLSGLLGGLPMTSEIVRGSVNINAGGQSKLATITHGMLLLASVLLIPKYLNMIPLSCLAAILLYTGARLVSPQLLAQLWNAGRYQFAPFVLTVLAIVFTDVLTGVVIGLCLSLAFILNSNLRRPIRRFVEKHLGGDVLHIELANQVSFLNRAALNRVLDGVPGGGQVLLDAHGTDYIDPDILDLIRDFEVKTAPARNIAVSLTGFRHKYQLQDKVQYLDYSSRELQDQLSPSDVLLILKAGHARFRKGERLTRDLARQVRATADRQHPLAVVLSCIDSRAPTELIFDVGVGDIFSIRIAGNILTREVLGSIEYACAVAHAKLIVVMGHSRCGAVTTAMEFACASNPNEQFEGYGSIGSILEIVQRSIDARALPDLHHASPSEKDCAVNSIAQRNVALGMAEILKHSSIIAQLSESKNVRIAGAFYDVTSGEVTFLPNIDD